MKVPKRNDNEWALEVAPGSDVIDLGFSRRGFFLTTHQATELMVALKDAIKYCKKSRGV